MKNGLLILASAIIFSLQGCGGGSGSDTNTSTNTADGGGGGGGGSVAQQQQVTGTAAVGAPIGPGTLSAVDANGNVGSTAISATGTFTLDISSLTPPILLKAEGTVGGQTAVEFSVIADKTLSVVNVTPVSTAIAARVMNDDPGTVFSDKSTTKIALMTRSAVDGMNVALGEVLAGARSAAGLAGSGRVDLLNTAFTADKTGLDRLLDLVSVSVQPNGAITVSNKTGAGSVTFAAGTATPSGNLGSVEAINTAGIDELGKRFQNLMANGSEWVPGGQAVSLFASGFKHEGMDLNSFTDGIEEAFGLTVAPAKVYGCSKVGSADVCDVTFGLSWPDGEKEDFYMPVIKGSDGTWKFYGDQAPAFTNINAVAFRTVTFSGTVDKTGMNVNVPINGAPGSGEDGKIGNSPIQSVKVFSGSSVSGTPLAQLVRPTSSGCSYLVTSASSCGNFVELTSGAIADIQASAKGGRSMFTVQYLNGSNAEIGKATIYMLSAPLQLSEIRPNRFATFSAAVFSAFQALTDPNATFTLAISPLPAGVVWEDVVGVQPADQDVELAGRTSITALRGGGQNIGTVTRDKDGRKYWYNTYY